MKSSLVAVLCLAFGIRTPGQTSTTYDTGKGHWHPADPHGPKRSTEHVARRNGYLHYYAEAKMLVLHLTNISGKDITAYNITVRNKYADGTQDDPCCGTQSTSEFLGG